MRRAARVDANQTEIADAYRVLGCSFLSLASMGEGCPDAVVGYGGLSALIEIKDGKKPPSRRKLRPAQEEFRQTWKGGVRLIDSLAAVAEHVNVLRAWRDRLSMVDYFSKGKSC